MNPLERRLRETMEIKAATVRTDPDAYALIVARARTPGWWEHGWARAAAVGFVAVVAVTVLVPVALERYRPEPQVRFSEPPAATEQVPSIPPPTAQTAEPTAGPDQSMTPVTQWQWSRTPKQDGLAPGEFTTMGDVARVGDAYIAVGATSEGTSSFAALWRSADGATWDCIACGEREGLGAITQLLAVVAFEEGYVAVGETYDPDEPSQPLVWIGSDAVEPEAVVLPGEGIMRDVVWTGTQFVAVGEVLGESTREPAVWRSSDGRDWDLALLEGVETEATLDHVAAIGERVVTLSRDGGVHLSEDGAATWTYIPAAETGFSPQAIAFEDLIAMDERFFAVDVSTEEGPLAYASDGTGRSWQLLGGIAPTPQNGSTRVAELLVAPDGTLVAVGLTPDDGGGVRSAAWTSSDLGTTWQEVESTDFGAGTQMTAITAGPEGLVAIGQADDPEVGSTGAAWIAQP